MAEEDSADRNRSLALPMGAVGAALALALAAAAYNYMSSSGAEGSEPTSSKGKSGSMRRKVGLMTLITLLENDTTRKVVISVLKAMARRS